MDSRAEQLRERLYEAYLTTHAGVADARSSALAFRRDVAPHLPRSRTVDVLDVGCGQGLLVKQLLDTGFLRARGIDISPEQIRGAHAAGITEVRLGDYREALAEGALDVVIATDFFEHLTKFEVLEAADRVRRALRSGGTLILRVPNAGSPFGGNLRHGDLTHETSFTPRSLQQLGAAAGFEHVAIYPCTPPIHGVKSALRASVWRICSGIMKLALIAETGRTTGHVVTQNMVGVLSLSGPDADDREP